jgi:hypothetical protein
MNLAKTLLVQRTVLDACDRLDGAATASSATWKAAAS